VLIFDLGGGTFDVSLLSIEGGVYEVRSTAGDTHLGGEDFDSLVLDWLSEQILSERKRRGLQTVDDDGRCLVRRDDALRRRLRTAAEQAKRDVSTADWTSVSISDVFPHSPSHSSSFSVPFSRMQLESLCSSLFASTLTPVEQVLRDAKLSQADVHDVVLIGGSTRIPAIRSLLSAFFQHRPLCLSINPDEAVAYGASVQAAMLTGRLSPELSSSLLLIDVIPMSLGLETAGGLMSVIIPRNTTIPCRRVQPFTTHADYQAAVEVRVYEGERMRTADNLLLGVFEISQLPLRLRGQVRIDVVFELDVNGILTVHAVETETGSAGGLLISNDRGLREAEVRQLVQEMELRKREENEEKKQQLHSSRQALQGYVHELSQRLKGDEAVQSRLGEVERWIREMEGREEEEELREGDCDCYELKQRQLEGLLMPALMQAGMVAITRRLQQQQQQQQRGR
jgi:heat shock protein 1/8